MSETDDMGDLYYLDGEDPTFGYSYRITLVVLEKEPVECNDDLNVELSIYDLLSNDNDGSNAVVYDVNLSGAMNPSSGDFLRRRLGGESGLPSMALDDIIGVICLVYGCEPLCMVGKIKANVRVEIYEDDLVDEDDVNNEYDFVKPSPASREAVEALEKVTIGQSVDDKETNCAVCLEEFLVGSEATKMPCSHVFHGECIVMWLENRFVCPICRFALPAAREPVK